MAVGDSEVQERAAIVEWAFAERLDDAIDRAMVNADVSLSVERAGVDDQWLRERIRSARTELADATRRDLDRYVDQFVAYVARYGEDPQARWNDDERRSAQQQQDRQLVDQRLNLWVQRLASAVEEEIAEGIGDWIRDRPGSLELMLGSTPRWGVQARPAGIAYTSDARRFRNVCADNPTGAIGLAGPRGCGKSTLLSHDLGAFESEPLNPAARKVRVMVSAPVKYESQDFLLHLFAEICRSVVKQRHPAYWERFPLLRRRFPTQTVKRSAATAVVAYLAAVLVSQNRLGGWAAAFGDAAAYFNAVWAWMKLPFGEGTFPYADPDALTTLLLLISAGATCVAVRRTLVWMLVVRRGRDLPPIVRSARRHLETIRTLQIAATTGVNSEFGIGGVKLSANRSVERSVRAWSYPELISEMKEFLGQVTGEVVGRRGRNSIADYDPFGVVVVIDELDKIDSVEDVQRFINEIKGIFDAPGTQVLVSISEDALAAFEMRGLPVRDAFDSAFAQVVRIGYLSIADTRRILERLHSPALSRPFVWLVYCLSGGLPRDVIRVSGELQGMARTRPGERLSSVCRELVGQDIRRRLPAFEQACGDLLRATEAGSEAPILELVREIRRVAATSDPPQSANLTAVVPRLLAAVGVGDLGKQTGCYLYFCATVLDILVINELDVADEERYIQLLPVLVEGRQAMAVHPDLAAELIDEFRGKWGLPVLARRAV
ncbi:hypothetical protein ACFVDI_05810 [Nocardioides sp. NPDC057767]|uniref:hypothetical protein n=1 Tax=unclassified Nocardioides TaxID=2615069 RepID=UPI003670A5F0